MKMFVHSHILYLSSFPPLEHFDVRATGLTGVVSTEICEMDLDVLWAACKGKVSNSNELVCDCCEDC